MRILVFSDIHGDIRALERLMDIEADYYFAAGDIVSWGRGLDAVGEILARRGRNVYVLPGNHETGDEILRMCGRHGLSPFHGRFIEAGGYHLAGFGYSTPTPFNTPGECSEDEMAAGLKVFSGLNPLALICHCPPLDTKLDLMHGTTHAGSRAVREFIDSNQPGYFFCGHIHEAHGVAVKLGRTRAWNTGKQGVLVDFDKIKS